MLFQIQLFINKFCTLTTFDISNCYHSINLNFDEFFKDSAISKFSNEPLQSIIVSIYKTYWEKVKQSKLDVFQRNVCQPLPLNLFSAHILANWFLSPLEKVIKSKYSPLYFGRYVDDCVVVCEAKSSSKDIYEAICQELPGLFAKKDDIRFSDKYLKRLSTLSVQKDKLFLYRFDCQLPQLSIEDSLNDFIERSSEYRFLTEEEDPYFSSLEDITLVNALEPVEEAGKRFNILEENGFLLSVYLSKLATQLSIYGSLYKRLEEVQKIYNYFKSSLVIKHYLMWERFFTIFVLAKRNDFVQSFYKRCKMVIDKIVFHENMHNVIGDGLNNLKKTLMKHLRESYLMAISLRGRTKRKSSIYLDTYMLRMRFNRYPMQEFTDKFHNKGLDISFDDYKFEKKLYDYRWLPYYKHLYEIISANIIVSNYSHELIKKSFSQYLKLNRIVT